jgi:transcriptional regulator of arginine metabolism
MYEKRKRQTALLKLVRGQAVADQNEMVRALKSAGIMATQASVSRDVRELGLVKAAGRYVPATRLTAGRAGAQPESPLSELITMIEPVGANLIVVRTRIGAASTIAVGIDCTASPAIVGTVAGDDTVFVAVRSRSAQGQAVALLKHLGLPASPDGPPTHRARSPLDRSL